MDRQIDRQVDRYELVEGKSSKFWEVGLDGTTLTVRFGRIGTDGQTKDKSFADAAAATKEKDKLVREKTGKGYALVGASADQPPAAKRKAEPAPEPLPAEPASPAAAVVPAGEPASPEPSAPEPTVAPPAAPAEEGRGLLFDGVPLPTRLRPGRRIGAEEAWAQFCDRLAPILPAGGKAEWVPTLTRAIAGAMPKLDADTAFAWAEATQATFDLAAPKDWKEAARWKRSARACLEALARVVVAVSGARVAAEVATRLSFNNALRSHYTDLSWAEPLHLALRAALVQAPEKDYDDAITVLTDHLAQTPDVSLAAAYAFVVADDRPERGMLQPLALLEMAEKAGADIAANRAFLPLIADAPPAEAARWRTKRSYHLFLVYCAVDATEAAATLIAVARAAGASALPALDWLLHYMTEIDRTIVAKAIFETREPGALAAIVPVLHDKWIRAAFDAAGEAYPGFILAQSLGILAGRSEPALRGRVADTIDRYGADAARQWAREAGGRAIGYLDKLLAARDVPLADKADWPRVLREPPWRQKARAKDDIVLDLAPIATPDVVAMAPAEPDRWRHYGARVIKSMDELPAVIAEAEQKADDAKDEWTMFPPRRSPVPQGAALLPWLEQRLRQIDSEKSYYHQSPYYGLLTGMEQQPEPLALMLWSLGGIVARRTHISMLPSVVSAMLARFGDKAVPGLVGLVEAEPIGALGVALPVDTAGIAPFAARALLALKKARVPALAWLRRHHRTAMVRLVPDAVGKPGAVRDAAEHGLRFLVGDRDDGRATLDSIVARYAAAEPRVAEAVGQVLERDPLARVPAKVGKPPAWVVPGALARPRLRGGSHSGRALPDEAVLALVEMLSFVNPDDVYAGVAEVREACTADSLAAFAWDLFSAWTAAGTPSKDGWALRAVGWLGDDSCARELTRLIRRWPGESAHQRAVTGLDVLVDIGSDVALMGLNGIAEKLKFKGLQEKARAKIATLAEARGLSPEELADRLAPDLDLDERGGLDLSFGPRGFRVGFDETLKPWVKDSSGQRLKDLPKPIKSDDAEKGAAAIARWAALKKDARAVASLQVARLEAMLATSRRVRPEVFQLFFAAHPLVRHLTQRLVWATFPDADPRTIPSQTFRVAEDLTFTDAADEPAGIDVTPEAQGLIGLLHPLHLPDGGLAPWGALFGDYEIAQPFPQLARETYALTEAEKGALKTDRFDGIVVEAKRLRGIAARGWELGSPQDGGGIWWIERAFAFPDGAGGIASLSFSDGLVAGGAQFEDEEQTLRELTLESRWGARQQVSDRAFGMLDPIAASELLRGPSLLAETRLK